MKKPSNFYIMEAIIIGAVIAFMLLTLSACDPIEVLPAPATTTVTLKGSLPPTTTTLKNSERIALYWENTTEPHPERKPWSDHLVSILSKDLPLYEAAKDVQEICPKFHSLSKVQKLKVLGDFWAATAYYESSFNPNSNSVDVGKKDDLGSYSVGLFQMSANDSSCKVYKATFQSLKDPLVNINCATEQMRKQLQKRSKIFLDNSDSMRYWAVLLKGNKYSKVSEITARVKKLAICQ